MRSLFLFASILTLLFVCFAIPEPTYTVHYVRSYRSDQIEKNFGCGQSIVYGTYLYPLGPVDALYTLINSHMYGFNANCQRKDTYVKIFGTAQKYQLLIDANPAIVDQIANTLSRANTKKLIIDWKYLPQQGLRLAAKNSLQKIATSLQAKGFIVYIKAPASYFCLYVQGQKYIIDLPVNQFIVELYGEQAGKYTTFESIFGVSAQTQQNGYTAECPRFPSRLNLYQSAPQKKFYFEKTVDSFEKGFIGPLWHSFLQKAGEEQYGSIYFLDGHPRQTVDL